MDPVTMSQLLAPLFGAGWTFWAARQKAMEGRARVDPDKVGRVSLAPLNTEGSVSLVEEP